MLKPALGALSYLIEGAKVAGTIGSVVAVGELVAKETGAMPREKSVIGEAVTFVRDVAGFPAKTDKVAPAQLGAASGVASSAPALPPAPASALMTQSSVCPYCQDTKPFTVSGTNEVVLENCEPHEKALASLNGYITAIYNGWAQHYGVADLGASVCGKKPVAPKKYNALAQANYLAQLASWQQCVDNEKQQQAAAKAAEDQKKAIAAAKKQGASVQQKIAAQLLAAQQKKSDQAIADLKAQYAAEQDAEKQAQIQAQIDAANAAKAASDKALADLQAKVSSESQAKEIADLRAQILSAGQKSGGMDQLMQFLMMQQQMQMQQQAPQMMAPGAPAMYADGGAMPWAPPGDVMPYAEDPYAQAEFYSGAQTTEQASEQTADDGSSLGDYFGIEGLSDDDGQLLFNTIQSGNLSEDVAALLRDQEDAAMSGSCLSGCGIR